MNPAYLQAYFEVEGNLPSSFVVITAYNPRGLTAPMSRNQHQDTTLSSVLRQKGHEPIRVIGRDQENTHREPGWAVDIDLNEAKKLGQLFKQDAIYQVIDDELSLHGCLGKYKEVIGSWKDRVI